MKNKISKILGVVLVLTVLAGLLVSAVPVAAANLVWTAVTTPAVSDPAPGNVLVAGSKPASYLLAGAADGKSLFAYDNTNFKFYRSVDAGLSWTKASATSGLTASAMVDLAVSSDFANDKTVVTANSTAVFASTNSGVSFGVALADITAQYPGGTITSVAVSPYYTGTGVAIMVGVKAAGNGGAIVLVPGGFGGTWTKVVFPSAVDVFGVAFSPNHRNDALSIFVTANSTGAAVESKFGTNAVDLEFGKAPVPGTTLNNTNITKVSMAFAQDYGAAGNQVFVGINATVDGSDVYRANLSYVTGTNIITSTVTDLNASGTSTATNVNSLSFKGNLADGWLLVGQDNGLVKRATTAGASTLTFLTPQKNPTGTMAEVFASPASGDANIFALTAGDGSAFSVSTDNAVNFNMISLIWVSNAAVAFPDLKVIDANNMFLIMKDADTTILFKTTNGGTNWQGVFSESSTTADMMAIYPSPAYATDNTLYVTQGDNRIWKSSNAGQGFIGFSAPGTGSTISSFVAIDANTYFVGTSNGLFKSGSYVAPTGATSAIYSIAYIDATTMYVGFATGGIASSSNGGTSFAPFTPATGLAAPVQVYADPAYATNKYIYVTDGTTLKRFQVGGTNLDWGALTTGATAGSITRVSFGTEGTMYVSASSLYRCVTPASPGPQTFESMNFTNSGMPTGLTAVKAANVLATGSAQVPNNTIYAVIDTADPDKVYTIQDTLVTAPGITAPAANSQVATSQNLTWTAPAGSTGSLKYDIQVGLDNLFANKVVDETDKSGTLYVPAAGTLTPGMSYFWRVRVSAGDPMASKWSAATAFSVKLAQAGNDLTGNNGEMLQPAAGSSNVPTKPVFQWAAINGAQSYDLQVADNPVFVNPLDSQTGLNTNVWTYTKTLDPGKTYYWRVRAVAANGTASDWVSSAFTTAVPAPSPTATGPAVTQPPVQVVTPTITVNIPTQAPPTITVTVPQSTATAAPTTPASIWVLIAIGAILIIAVIVLIARTRRV